ncbi:hypothetical protein KBB96_09330 [Luteolibacter ambystomatis]|uniref:Uncharacterized protein n=1 Tax=Luteolibacter ambystomatis TaxID=2824561 RepID=A0A975PGZ5_9BACT|nr:hypothetical protein [Luteolibacter ambystomatis]QUE53080.1 hypothetical protein KBB96_09330 [Luteolibacter ambystomatis]
MKTTKVICVILGAIMLLGVLAVIFFRNHYQSNPEHQLTTGEKARATQQSKARPSAKSPDQKIPVEVAVHEKKKNFYIGENPESEISIDFSNEDMSISIRPANKNCLVPLNDKDLYFYQKMLKSDTCGEFIGIEMVGGDGKYLTLVDDAYAGVFYNRDESRISMLPFGLDSTAQAVKPPDIKVSLIDLISRLKPALKSDESMAAIDAEGLRFRIRVNLPSDGTEKEVRTGWIQINETGRNNLIQYLEF